MAAKKPISKMNKAELEKLAKKEGVEVSEDASKAELYDAIKADRGGEGDSPKSEVPPTSGPEDVVNSGMIDQETGETLLEEQPYTGDHVDPAETVADGGPQPPQPRGGDEPDRPLEQTGAPGFKSEADVAAAEVEAKEGEKALREREREAKAAEKAAKANKPKPGIEVGHPRAMNTQLTIIGRNFPPGKTVRVALSGSRFPTGETATSLRAGEDGFVQANIFPSPGKQSVSMKADGASAKADFDIVDPTRR